MKAQLECLRISAHALLKAQDYARLVAERFGPVECAGFLLSQPRSLVIDEVTFAQRQEVDECSVTVPGDAVLAAGREAEAGGWIVRGWWHSHGEHSVFHSATDVKTTSDLLEQICFASGICDEEELAPSLQPDGGMVFERENETLRVILPASAAGPVRVRLVCRVEVGVAFSLVVNARGDPPRAEVCLRHPGSDGRIERRAVPIAITSGLDRELMRHEVEGCVQRRRGRHVEATADTVRSRSESPGVLARTIAWFHGDEQPDTGRRDFSEP